MFKSICISATVAIFSLSLATATARAGDLIDTTPYWNGTSFVYSFGVTDTENYGQTVTVPSDGNNILQSFTFYIQPTTAISFQGEVYAWNGVSASGSQLYQSSTISLNPTATFQAVTFTPSVALTPGGQYVLFATTDNQNQSVASGSYWGQPQNSDVYPGGSFVFINDVGDDSPALWTTTPWNQTFLGTGSDLAFQADFTSVPEPVTGLLLSSTAFFLLRRQPRTNPK